MYEFAELVYANVLGEGGFDDDTFSDLFEGPDKAARPCKDTLLHDVIRNVVGFYLDYSTGHCADLEVDRYRSILAEAGLSAPYWLRPEHVERHIRSLDRLLGQAVAVIAPTVFYVLFSDRQFLIAFQGRVAAYIGALKREDHPEILVRDGVLKRPKHLPAWLKAGVFYRDRGRCQNCSKDLSGLSRPVRDLNLDHIIPLAAAGSNDPSNFQLLCTHCNSAKGTKKFNEPPKFAPYW